MRVIFHLGCHGTDEERLISCLLHNHEALAAQGIAVPSPPRYRTLLRDTARSLNGGTASAEVQQQVLDQILDGQAAQRLVLSWENFLSYPQWAVKDRLYPAGAERLRAFRRVLPGAEVEFHLAIRGMDSFLPLLAASQPDSTPALPDPQQLRWARLIEEIRTANPDVALTVWSDEDAPLIWPEILQALSGHGAGLALKGADMLLAQVMSPEGLARMHSYLDRTPPESALQRRRVVAAFLDKFALSDRVDLDVDLPGWSADLLTALQAAYAEDLAQIRRMPGVTLLTA